MLRSLLCALLLLLGSTVASAQRLHFGLTAGLHLSETKLDGGSLGSLLKSKDGTGWLVGARAELPLFLGFSAGAGLHYNQYNYRIDAAGLLHTDVRQHNLDLPIELRWGVKIAKVRLFVGTGPKFSFALGNENDQLKSLVNNSFNALLLGTNNSGIENVAMHDQATSWRYSIGARWEHFELSAHYHSALSHTAEGLLNDFGLQANKTPPTLRLNSLSLQATYYF